MKLKLNTKYYFVNILYIIFDEILYHIWWLVMILEVTEDTAHQHWLLNKPHPKLINTILCLDLTESEN